MYICREPQARKDEDESGSIISAASAAGSNYSCDVTATVSTSDVIQEVEDHEERPGEMCVGPGKQDDVIIVTRRLLTQLYS